MLKSRLLSLGLQPYLTALCLIFILLSLFWWEDAFAYASIVCGAYFALKSAWVAAREKQIDVNVLMLLAAAGAVILGRPLEAAGLLFLFSLSNTLEQLAMARTKAAIEGLIKLRPKEAILIRDGSESRVAVESLRIADVVRVPAYENIPVDGTLLSANASVDEASITGESIPREKTLGDKLFCGTQNLHQMMTMSVTAPAGETTLDRVVELVRAAQDNKAESERISTWFGSRYTVFVVLAFAASFFIRLALGQTPYDSVYHALVLLVALSPCALVISTPASTLSALAWAARRGILVRGGKFIEEIGRIDTAAFDKTGTLTFGKPGLHEICLLQELVPANAATSESPVPGWLEGETMPAEAKVLLRLAATAEQYSSHPVATAIVTAARANGVEVPEATKQSDIPGLGVQAEVDGISIMVGQRRLIESKFGQLSPRVQDRLAAMQAQGMSVALLVSGNSIAAFGVRDVPRAETKSVIAKLRSFGISKILMLSGDTPETARAIGTEIGIEDVHAGLLPDQKTEFISHLLANGRKVMMVGDGINDAPSLASANVGIAMGGIGSDITLNAADVVLMRDNLEGTLDLLRLGRQTVKVINANLAFAAIVIVSLTAASFAINLPLWMAVLGHEGSTVVVLLNALRLLKGPPA